MKRSIFLPVIFSLSLLCTVPQKVEAIGPHGAGILAFCLVGAGIQNLGRSLPDNTFQKDLITTTAIFSATAAAIIAYKHVSKENK